VAAGDITGDGVAELVITPDEGGGPRVTVRRGGDFAALVDYFGINDPNFRGGVRAGVGDINADGFGDVVLSAGFGGGPRISVWDGKFLSSVQFHNLMGDFFAFDSSLRNGAYVSVGDVNGDGFGDIIAGAGPGGAPHIKVLSGSDLLTFGPGSTQEFATFFAGDPGNRGGVRVAAKDLDGDGFVDLLTGPGDGNDVVTAYRGSSLAQGGSDILFTNDPFGGILDGVFVG
jgi:hypothetical protein